jgi:hypothetical protein
MSDHALAWRKSSYSTNGTCVEVALVPWRTSSYSSNGACVQAAAVADGVVAVRNSNHPEAGTITVGKAPFGTFLDAVRAGMMDG